MKNKIELKKFFGTEVRVVNEDWIVMKDMFGALGRLRDDGQMKGEDKEKVVEVSNLLNLRSVETFIVPTKVTKSKGGNKKEFIDMNCVNLKDAPIVLTQFKPTARAGEEAFGTWVGFMKFANDLLIANDVNVFDLTDKRNQISAQVKLDTDGGKVVVMNNMLSQMMAELCGVEGKILKGDIRTFQEEHPRIRLDLGLVYEEMREDFVNAFSFTQSHANAKDMVLKKYKRKYDLNK
ncbi:MAG: hypothetical protein ACRCZ2_01085 [Fusobacteriaceae bacterium]